MDDEKSKEKQRQRYLRGLRHEVGHEEHKRRKIEAARRKSARGGGRRTRRDWGEVAEDAEGSEGAEGFEAFEKIRRVKPAAAAPGAARGRDHEGLPRAVVAAVHHGRVELDNGETARLAGHLFVDPEFRIAVGDEVAYDETGGQARIQARLPRRTCLSRPDPGAPRRALVLAANVDLGVIVVAATAPPLRPGLIDRLLLALGHGGVAPLLCVNKVDLLTAAERATVFATLAAYPHLGCDVVPCSAATGESVGTLRARLTGRTCVFVGHSGVGKSSLLNAIDPGAARRTGDTRAFDGKGRHTTTASSLRDLGGGTRVIDTPGVRSFGLDALDAEQVRAGFPEFEPFASRCRFTDCTHVHEPACGVRAAVAAAELDEARYASYLRILEGD